MKAKVFLIELSPVKPDGSRSTISEKILATCDEIGTARLIAHYFKEGAYKKMLSVNDPNARKYLLTAETRKHYKNYMPVDYIGA